jgi:hypothetical protein
MRKDTKTKFEWRVRNMPYPKETYIVECDHQKQQIVLKTTNKKYYKRIDLPDMRRVQLQMVESSITWRYQNQTVIIGYDKPAEVLAREKKMLDLAHASV